MRVLIGVAHPKQVHMFKNLIYELKRNNHDYLVLVNEKEITCALLDSLKIKYKTIGKNKTSITGKLFQLFFISIKTFIIALRFKPTHLIGQAVTFFILVKLILRKPFIILEDTESSVYVQKLVNPFSNAIIVPSSYREKDKDKLIVNGGFELLYLHPKYFIPNPEVLKKIGLEVGDRFIIMRFVSWKANHDIGHTGLSDENKKKAIEMFKPFARVLISSETPLSQEMEAYKFTLPPEDMHHAIFYSSMVYGESATMAAEAAYLGIPAIYLDDVGRGYTDNLEKEYNLISNFTESPEDQIKSIERGIEILSESDSLKWKRNREKLLNNSIDVNKFTYWFLNNFPESIKIMKENPDYQFQFK